MKIRVQWATNPPTDWDVMDSMDWINSPCKPSPPFDRKPIFEDESIFKFSLLENDNITINQEKGWINKVAIQGLVISSDHVAVIDHVEYVEVLEWNDDLGDWNKDDLLGRIWHIYPISNNTKHFMTAYVSENNKSRYNNAVTSGGKVKVMNFQDFPYPNEKFIKHGIWIPTDIWNESSKCLSSVSWKD